MVFLIVGISGVGKSSLCGMAVRRLRKVCHIDVDARIPELFKDGAHWPEFYEVCKDEICNIEREFGQTETTALCDIGAGFLKIPDAFNHLRSRPNVILIHDKLLNVYNRVKKRSKGPCPLCQYV